jgi:hypothetical protein
VEVTLKGTGPGGEDIRVSGRGRVLRAEPAAKAGWYELAAVFDEPYNDESGWYKLAASFDEPPSPATNS